MGSQEIPGVTGKFGLGVQNEAGQRLTMFCQENSLVIANTLFQQHKTLHMDITKWSIPKSDWLYSLQLKMEKLCTISKNMTKADWGSDHELLIAKFRLKLKKVGKTMGFPGSSAVDNSPAMQESQEMQVRLLGLEEPLEEGMATLSSILAWRIPMDRGAWWATVHRVTKSQT